MPGLSITLPEQIEELERKGEEAGPSVVILYNCDCHSFDEVILQLQKATGCALEKAGRIAVEAHFEGRAIAYTGSADECERAASVLRSIGLQVETDRV
jgi:ATP-dependent Clp protease adapter protein ClpS